MKITYDLDLETFEPWAGAVDTLERIKEENKLMELENLLEELYPDGLEETKLNDILWFEEDFLFSNLGISTEEEEDEEED